MSWQERLRGTVRAAEQRRHLLPMSIEEQSLRDLLASPHGTQCVKSIMDWIRKGEHVVIEMRDGTPLVLVGVPEAELALKLWFDWPKGNEG